MLVVMNSNAAEIDIQRVLPLLTAPSQMIASQFLNGLRLHHQLSTVSCFLENSWNLILAFISTLRLFYSTSFNGFVER